MNEPADRAAPTPESKPWQPVTQRGGLNTDIVDGKTFETLAEIHLAETAAMQEAEELEAIRRREALRREEAARQKQERQNRRSTRRR